MRIAAHAAAVLFSIGMIAGSFWFIRAHFIAYADRMIDALLMGKDDQP